jgi:hypothetical protein
MQQGGHIRFNKLLEQHLTHVVQRFVTGDRSLTPALLHELRDAIRATIIGIFTKSTHAPSVEAINWVADEYFKAVNVQTSEGTVPVGELIIHNEYKLAAMSYSDIELLRNLFNDTKMGPKLEQEYSRRTIS